MHHKSFVVQGKLTPKELTRVQNQINAFKHKSRPATLYTKGEVKIDPDIRSGLTYFPPVGEFRYSFNLIQSLIIEKYSCIYSNLDYSNISEIQFSSYAQNQFFKKHQDAIVGPRAVRRCLTMSINITDETKYEGGDLVIFCTDETVKLSKEIGSYVIFPAFYFHEAREVLSGIRESIVTWINSPTEDFNKFKTFVES